LKIRILGKIVQRHGKRNDISKQTFVLIAYISLEMKKENKENKEVKEKI
jgi:hypothetical protein